MQRAILLQLYTPIQFTVVHYWSDGYGRRVILLQLLRTVVEHATRTATRTAVRYLWEGYRQGTLKFTAMNQWHYVMVTPPFSSLQFTIGGRVKGSSLFCYSFCTLLQCAIGGWEGYRQRGYSATIIHPDSVYMKYKVKTVQCTIGGRVIGSGVIGRWRQ